MIELDLVGQDMRHDVLFDELDVTFAKLEIHADFIDDQAVFDCQHFLFRLIKKMLAMIFKSLIYFLRSFWMS